MEIVAIIAELLGPLVLAGEDRAHLRYLLDELGETTEIDDELFTRYQQLVPIGELREIAELAQALADPDDPREPGDIVGQLIPLTEVVLDAVTGLANLSAGDLAGLVAPLDDPDTWRELALALPEYLLGRFLTDYHPVLAGSLGLLGTLRRIDPPDNQADGEKQLEVLDLEQFGALLAGPTDHLRSEYGWGGEFDYPTFADRVEALILATGRKVGRRPGPDGFDELDLVLVDGVTGDGGYAQLVLTMSAALAGDGRPDGVAVSTGLLGSLTAAPIGDAWTLTADGPLTGAEVAIRPSGPNLAGATGAGFTLAGVPVTPWVLIGSAAATRLELTGAAITAAVEPGDVSLVAQLGATPDTGLRMVLAAAETDPFLSALLSADVTVDMGLAVTWSWSGGVSFGGSIGFEVTIPIYRTLGPIEIGTVTVALGPDGLVVAAALSGSIGPVAAAVDGLGIRMLVTPTPGGGTGALGSYQIAFAIEPPHGVGLAIDAGVASGGGYLDLERELGRYAGVLDVQVLTVGICAIALIDTQAPDVDGWSMFFALFITLPLIPLGFGFTLNGVGGLVGINRRLDNPALESAIRSGALDSVLFPEKPIEDAPYIIDQLRAIFPPSPDRYVFGPVVQIGWGVPTLIEAELGVVISVPEPISIAVLGSVSSILPTPDVGLIVLHLDVGGSVDTESGLLSISAMLHDSQIVGFALSGGMALRADFGAKPSFLMSVGGFHPGFIPPDDFPTVEPLSLAIAASPVLHIYFGCYFAISSNTVQFGSVFELSAKVAGFGIEGGSSFDALVQFSPFQVRTHIGFYVAITAGSVDLAGVWLDARLEGPNPWHVIGTARFTILGISDSVTVNEEIGWSRAEPGLEAVDARPALKAALSSADAWTAVATTSPGVVLAAADPSDGELAAMPDGLVTVNQQVVPLGIQLDKIGDAPIGRYDYFTVEPAPGTTSTGDLTDWFAPGYYFELASTEQLSAPSFELLSSGLEFGGGEPTAGPARVGTLEYEQILRDPELEDESVELPLFDLTADTRDGIRTAPISTESRATLTVAAADAPMSVLDLPYSVTDELTGAEVGSATSWSAAHQSSAARRTGTVVVPAWEVAS